MAKATSSPRTTLKTLKKWESCLLTWGSGQVGRELAANYSPEAMHWVSRQGTVPATAVQISAECPVSLKHRAGTRIREVMPSLTKPVAVLAAVLTLGAPALAQGAAAGNSPWSMFETYCTECHNATDWAGGVAF